MAEWQKLLSTNPRIKCSSALQTTSTRDVRSSSLSTSVPSSWKIKSKNSLTDVFHLSMVQMNLCWPLSPWHRRITCLCLPCQGIIVLYSRLVVSCSTSRTRGKNPREENHMIPMSIHRALIMLITSDLSVIHMPPEISQTLPHTHFA